MLLSSETAMRAAMRNFCMGMEVCATIDFQLEAIAFKSSASAGENLSFSACSALTLSPAGAIFSAAAPPVGTFPVLFCSRAARDASCCGENPARSSAAVFPVPAVPDSFFR